MKKMLLEYVKLISYAIVGLVFAYAAFFLFINFYHQQELNKDYRISVKNDVNYQEIKDSINYLKDVKFDTNTYRGDVDVQLLIAFYTGLHYCGESLSKSPILSLENKTSITNQDVWTMTQGYKNDIVNTCLVNGFQFLNTLDAYYGKVPADLKTKQSSLLSERSLLLQNYWYLENDLKNNHSYFFMTGFTNRTTTLKPREGYNNIMSAYQSSLRYLVSLKKAFDEEVQK